jgi:hypothetical protein
MDTPASPLAKPTDSIRKKKKRFGNDTKRFLPIAEIKDDTVVLKNGGLRAVLSVSAINFNLKSETEQQGIIAGYESFLNTLTFPIQIVLRSSHLNIDPYIASLRNLAEKQGNALLKKQTSTYADFVERIVNVADIMDKKFFVIVPIDGYTKTKKGLIAKFLEWMSADDSHAKAMQRHREFDSLAKLLRDRVLLVQSGLENVGITSRKLSTASSPQ